MIRAGIAFGAAWLLALGVLATPALSARADVPVANQQFAGVPVAPTTSGIPGNPQVGCPPTCAPSCDVAKCVGGSGSVSTATATSEGENESLATFILILICLAGVFYAAVKFVQQRRAKGAEVIRLQEPTAARLPEGEA